MSIFATGNVPQAYVGVRAPTPPNFTLFPRDPYPTDWQGYTIGDLWMNSLNYNVWILASLAGNQALWLMFANSFGSLLFLTGNTGGPVPPLSGNINVVGDSIGITIAGNAATHTLTASVTGIVATSYQTDDGNFAIPVNNVLDVFGDGPRITTTSAGNTITIHAVGTGLVSTLTGNNGLNVYPIFGNIDVVGDTVGINIIGNPATHTLTASLTGVVATSYPTNSGTATPALGVLNVLGDTTSIVTSGAGNTVTIAAGPDLATTYTTDDHNTATPALGNLNIFGDAPVIETTSAGSTVTINAGPAIPLDFYTDDTNHATATLNRINVYGDGVSVNTTSAGNTITIHATGTGTVESLTADSGGAVPPTAGNINIQGDGTTITTVGHPGTSTINIGIPTTFYSTGNFNPVMLFGGVSAGTQTNNGKYTRIGNVCLFSLNCIVTKGVATGTANITGLPFPSSADATPITDAFMNTGSGFLMPSSRTTVHARFLQGSINLNFRGDDYNSGAGPITLNDTNFGTNIVVAVNGLYFI